MAPTSMRGIKVLADGKAEVQDVPLPELRDGYVLVKVNCVAINPIDWRVSLLQASISLSH